MKIGEIVFLVMNIWIAKILAWRLMFSDRAEVGVVETVGKFKPITEHTVEGTVTKHEYSDEL